MKVTRTALALLGCLSLATGTVLTTGAAGTADPGHAAPAATAAARERATNGTVTLPTGDRYSIRHDGAAHTRVTPAAGSAGSYLTMRLAGDEYLVPDTAFRSPGSIDPSRYDVSAALRGSAPASVHPDFPMRTVTFTVLDERGQPAIDGLIAVVNTDDSQKYMGAPEVVNGVAKASVPDGHYSILQYGRSTDGAGAPGAARIGFVDFTVAGAATTVTVNGLTTATHQVTFGATPKPTTRNRMDVSVMRGSSAQGWVYLGYSTVVDTPVYLGSTGTPTGFQHVEADATFLSPDGAATPYSYSVLFYADGAVGPDQHHPIVASSLATLTMRYHADAGSTGIASVTPMTHYTENFSVAFVPVTLPLRETVYVTADPNVYLEPAAETDPMFETMTANLLSYRPGQQVTFDWNAGPEAPSLPADPGAAHYFCLACRTGDTLSLYPSPLSDSTPDHYDFGAPYGGATPGGHVQLYQGNTKLADATGTNGVSVAVDPGDANYRLVLDNTRAGATLSTSSHTEWTFHSGHSAATTVPSTWDCDTYGGDAGCSAVDLLAPHYALAQSLTGTVPTGAQTLNLTIGHSTNLSAPAVTAAMVQVSYDGGTTWRPATVTAKGTGRYAATWTSPASSAGKHISFKIGACDAAGDILAQTVTDAVTVAS